MKIQQTKKGVKPGGSKHARRMRRRIKIIAASAGAAFVLAAALLLIFIPTDGDSTVPVSSQPADRPQSEPPAVVLPLPALKAASENNPDVIGWLTVAGCEIDDPVVQGLDNDKYLRRTIESEEYDVWGCYFLDYINAVDETNVYDRVTIIYGHSLDDYTEGEKFSKLKRYKDSEFAREHPTIAFSLLEKAEDWEIFAACDIPISIDYIDPNPDDEKYGETLRYMLEHSYCDFGVEASVDDQILVLSTCTGDENVRFVVAARRTEGN